MPEVRISIAALRKEQCLLLWCRTPPSPRSRSELENGLAGCGVPGVPHFSQKTREMGHPASCNRRRARIIMFRLSADFFSDFFCSTTVGETRRNLQEDPLPPYLPQNLDCRRVAESRLHLHHAKS